VVKSQSGNGRPSSASRTLAADEIQLVARVSEHAAELTQHIAAAVQRNLRTGKQFGVRGGIGHVRTA